MEALGLKIRAMQHEMERYLDYVHAQTFSDPLTHVGNTNAYQEEVRRLDEQIRNGSADFCAIVFDIDNLKIVNDRFGHSCGDRIIRGAGMAIAGVFGRDRTFRIGGDEFIAIPLGLTEAQANAKLFSVDLAVKSFNATPVHPDAALSLSAGVAACRKSDKCFRDVFVRADESMYKTKGEHHRCMSETGKK
jgi:diguanylate cyclase (GGDEF)-like protein